MFFALLLLEWKCTDKKCTSYKSEIELPLSYSEEGDSEEIITLELKKIPSKTKNIPIFVLTNGNGFSNVDNINFTKYTAGYTETTFYFVGYRGIDSSVTINGKNIGKFIKKLPRDIKLNKLEKAVNKTIKDVNIDDFSFQQRARDVIEVIKAEEIEKVNIYAVGPTGSLIAQQLLSDYPQFIENTAIIQSSAPSEYNDESIDKLVDTYRKICSSTGCSFKNLSWLPEDIPKNIMRLFPIDGQRAVWAANYMLRNPEYASKALDALNSIASGSKVSYNAFKAMPEVDIPKYKWFDMAMHTCALPADKSFLAPPGMSQVCQFLPEIRVDIKNNFTTPILLVNGELDLPRKGFVKSFYNNHTDPKLRSKIISQVFLPKDSAEHALSNPDVALAVIKYLVWGVRKFPLSSNNSFEIEPAFSIVKLIRLSYVGSFLLTTVMFIAVGISSMKESKQTVDNKFKKQSVIEKEHKKLYKNKAKKD